MQMLGMSCEGVHAAPRRPPCPAQLHSRYTLTRSFASQNPITLFRAKAGGKQSTQDATGKFAKSAGSRLRRYNEAALAEDVKSALTSWTALLGQCDLIHVQAPGSNWKDLMTAAPAVLSPSDPRLR